MSLTTAKQQVVRRDLTAKFDEGAMSQAAQPFYPQVCTEVTSDGADEEYGWLGSMPGVREWLGDRQFQELRAANYELVNKDWESSLRIKKNHIKDDRLGMYGPVLNKLAVRAMRHPDNLLFDLLENGETDLCFDGQAFFDTDHSWGDSGSQSNDLTHDASDHTAVTVAEFKAAWLASCNALLGFKDDRGEPIHFPLVERLSGLICVVPLALRGVAIEATQASLIGGGNTNVIIDSPRVVATASLSSSVKFYTLKVDDPVRPFIFQRREALSREVEGLDSIKTKDANFMTSARYAMGYGMWMNAVLTTFN